MQKRKNVGKKLLAAALCAALIGASFAGCGKAENKSGLDPEAVLLTVGDDKVTLQEGYFMMKWQQSEYQSMASSFYGDEWYNEDLEGNGETFLDYIKGSVMDQIQDMYICRQQAEALGVSLTEEEKDTIEETAQSFLNANSDETEAAMMADKETVIRVLENYTLYTKVFNEVVKDADTSVSAEEARQMVYSYIYQPLVTTDSDGNQTDYTDAEKQEIYAEFAAIAAAAGKDGDFDKACQDGGYEPSTHQFTADGSDDDSFSDINGVAAQLEVGQVSDLIPVEGGVFLLHLDTDNDEERTESKRQSLANEKQAAVFLDWVDAIKEETEIEVDEDLWAQVGFEEALQAVSEDSGE